MAPFNRRQIGYIQAIAGRQQHRTLTCGQFISNISSVSTPGSGNIPQAVNSGLITGCGYSGSAVNSKSLLLYNWLLDDAEAAYSAIAGHNDNKLTTDDITGLTQSIYGMGDSTPLNVFDAECAGAHALSGASITNWGASDYVKKDADATGELLRNPERVSSLQRATPDGFLNSTDLRFRFTLPREIDTATPSSGHSNSMGQDHYEFRWIVWRNKRPTLHKNACESSVDIKHTNLDAIRDGVSFRNPGYDLFMGQTGRKRGLLGYTLNNDLDKDQKDTEGEAYSGKRWDGSNYVTSGNTYTDMAPTNEALFTVDDLLTCRLNRDDYVIMKDVRFFLGKEHGKSHFEDNLHWDWNDPIDTTEQNVLTSTTLNDKNYRWHMTLIGTSGGNSECALNVHALWTTKMESG